MAAKLRVGINGFGRIGRLLFRSGFEDVDIVGINTASGSVESHAHFLKYDSTHGTYAKEIKASEQGIRVDGKNIPMSFERDPKNIPWKDWGADLVFECTGVFKDSAANQAHRDAGAKRVIVSAPAKVDNTFVYGINHENYNPEKDFVVSNASCTTNCLAPVAKVLSDAFGIESALMTTVHSYTNDQRILDSAHKDLRRARAAAVSMIPTSTGAAQAVGLVLPELTGKIHGMAIRVPTPNVSLVDLNANLGQSVTVEQVHAALQKASEGPLKGILACENAPLVSCDLNGNTMSATVDMLSTVVVGDKMVKVLAWYDNEVGFSCRMVDLARFMAEKGL